MKSAILRLLSSMKFWTMVAGLLATLGTKYGFSVDSETVLLIGGFFGVLLAAQGATDFGKERAKVEVAAGDLKREYDATGVPLPALAAGTLPVTTPVTVVAEEKKP